MTELVLKSRVSKQKLDFIVYFLKMLKIDAEVKNLTPKKIAPKDDPFAEVRGIWADRDIDGKTLRKQAWGIEE